MHETHERAPVNAHHTAAALSSAADGDLASLRFVEAERSLLGLPPASFAEPGARQSLWVRRLHTYEDRLPILNSADPVEFASARWLGRQLRQLKMGTLLPNRAGRIRGLLNTFSAR